MQDGKVLEQGTCDSAPDTSLYALAAFRFSVNGGAYFAIGFATFFIPCCFCKRKERGIVVNALGDVLTSAF